MYKYVYAYILIYIHLCKYKWKEELCERVVEVRRVSDRVMTAPQSGSSLEEKQSFYDDVIDEWDMHSAGDLVMCLGDFYWTCW